MKKHEKPDRPAEPEKPRPLVPDRTVYLVDVTGGTGRRKVLIEASSQSDLRQSLAKHLEHLPEYHHHSLAMLATEMGRVEMPACTIRRIGILKFVEDIKEPKQPKPTKPKMKQDGDAADKAAAAAKPARESEIFTHDRPSAPASVETPTLAPPAPGLFGDQG